MAEDNVFVIQPLGFHRANEKLRAVGVGAGVSHGENAGFRVFQLKVFIFEFVSENAFPTSAVAAREITALAHEFRDDTVEAGSFIAGE